ncbi:MAG: hypothetical protein ACRDTK_00580 [Mycobacterium sp.]
MPNHSSATQMLRDDIMAQLRAGGRPMTTTELRKNAPKEPTRGSAYLLAPLREQIYRVLRGLVHDGLVARITASGRTVTWMTTPGQADHEIAALEAALSISIDQPERNPARTDPVAIAAAHLKAASPDRTQLIQAAIRGAHTLPVADSQQPTAHTP